MVPYTLQASITFNEGGKGPVVDIDFNKKQKIKRAEPVFNAIEKVKEKPTPHLLDLPEGHGQLFFIVCLIQRKGRNYPKH